MSQSHRPHEMSGRFMKAPGGESNLFDDRRGHGVPGLITGFSNPVKGILRKSGHILFDWFPCPRATVTSVMTLRH